MDINQKCWYSSLQKSIVLTSYWHYYWMGWNNNFIGMSKINIYGYLVVSISIQNIFDAIWHSIWQWSDVIKVHIHAPNILYLFCEVQVHYLWVNKWLFRLQLRAVRKEQKGHVKGFSPVWVRMCRFKCDGDGKAL